MGEVFLFVLAILLIVYGYKFLELRQRQRDEQGGDANRRELTKQLARLEERVQVLERIVTDGSADLKRRLDELER